MRSVGQRVRNRFHVSVAEVADNDAWQIATIGVACVANEAGQCERIIAEIVDHVRDSRLDAELLEVDSEVIALGD